MGKLVSKNYFLPPLPSKNYLITLSFTTSLKLPSQFNIRYVCSFKLITSLRFFFNSFSYFLYFYASLLFTSSIEITNLSFAPKASAKLLFTPLLSEKSFSKPTFRLVRDTMSSFSFTFLDDNFSNRWRRSFFRLLHRILWFGYFSVDIQILCNTC